MRAMFGQVTIYADAVSGAAREGEEDMAASADGIESVRVEGPGTFRCNGDSREGAEWQCKRCGESLREEWQAGAWVYMGEADNDTCEVSADAPDYDGEDGNYAPHDAERVPLSWVNSAAIHFDAEHDEITLTISTADPRGAFGTTVKRSSEDGALLVYPPTSRRVAEHDSSARVVHYGTDLKVGTDDDGVSVQSLRSLAEWAETRGPGESLTDVVRQMCASLAASQVVRVECAP